MVSLSKSACRADERDFVGDSYIRENSRAKNLFCVIACEFGTTIALLPHARSASRLPRQLKVVNNLAGGNGIGSDKTLSKATEKKKCKPRPPLGNGGESLQKKEQKTSPAMRGFFFFNNAENPAFRRTRISHRAS
jgi:hypothetical protein